MECPDPARVNAPIQAQGVGGGRVSGSGVKAFLALKAFPPDGTIRTYNVRALPARHASHHDTRAWGGWLEAFGFTCPGDQSARSRYMRKQPDNRCNPCTLSECRLP